MEKIQLNRRTAVMITALLVSILFFLTLNTLVFSNNWDNTTIIAQVNVTNTEPHVFDIRMGDGSTASTTDIILTEGTTHTVWCNGTVWDYNGVPGDISSVYAIIYDTSLGSSGAADENYRYFNNSCTNITQLDSTNAVYSCKFQVWYYANNATWKCNMTVNDTHNINWSNESLTPVTIDSLYAINVTPVIDFGELGVLETSGDKQANISNTGNMRINITVEAWRNSSRTYDNYSMTCDLGAIPGFYQRYSSTSGAAWTSMSSVNNSPTIIPNFNLPQRTDGEIKNTTYWKLNVPLTVGGWCNGTVIFTATEI